MREVMPYCPECGKQVTLVAKLCEKCGCNLRIEDTEKSQQLIGYNIARIGSKIHPSYTAKKAARTTIQIIGRTIQLIAWLIGSGLIGGCLVTGILTLFVMNSDGTPITGIPNRFIGIPMIIFCPVAGLPATLLFLLSSFICGDDFNE